MRAQAFETNFRRLQLLLLGTLLCAGCGNSQKGPPKYAVSGTVLVNGKPVAGVVVSLHPAGAGAPGPNARQVGGMTDDEGDFELSTAGEGDGVPPGEYMATFAWLESEFPPRDRFGGAFSDIKTSRFRVTVQAAENVLEPFHLEFGK